MSIDQSHATNLGKYIFTSAPDVILVASYDQKEIPAHRATLRASSKYFDALLGPNYMEGRVNRVTLKDIDGQTLETIVNYCYTGHIDINDDNVDDVIAAASSMELLALEQKIAHLWSGKLNAGNCIQILQEAEKYYLIDLWYKSLQFCATNINEIQLHRMLNIDERNLGKILERDEINLPEERIFNLIVKWVERNAEEGAKCMPTILKLVRLKHIASKFLRENVEPFYRQHGCIELVNEEHQRRSGTNNYAQINLYRFPPSDIFCTCRTTSIVDEPQILVKKYNFNLDRWEHLKMFPLKRSETHAVFSNGKVFTLEYFFYQFVNVRSYDLINSRQELFKYSAKCRYGFVSVAVEQYIYVFGGRTANGREVTSCERFDTELKRWKYVRSMPIKSQIDAALEFNGNIFAVGKNRLFCYDPNSDKWTIMTVNQDMINSGQLFLHKSRNLLYAANEHGHLHQYDARKKIWTLIGRNDGSQIVSTIEHFGLTYTLHQDGTFKSEIPENVESLTELSKIEDARFPKSSFVSLYVNTN